MADQKSDIDPLAGTNPAIQSRNDGASITRQTVHGFYPYSTFVGGRQPEPKPVGLPKPENVPADLSKLHPETVQVHRTIVAPKEEQPVKKPLEKGERPWAAKLIG